LAGPAFSPDDSSTVHDFRPLRRLRPAPKVRRAAWFGRPPVAFLESLPTQSSAANGCLTARFILTDADDAAIVGATIHVSIMGMDDVVRDVITDSHGLAEHAFEAPETGFVSCQATTTVRGARIYSSDMVQSARILPVAGPAWRSVWLERETGTHRLHVHAEPVDGEPPGWQIYYRTNPRHWIGVPGEGRSPDGRLATIDEREVWPGPCAVRLSASDGRRHVGEEVVWFEAAGGPFAGLLVDADPPVERNGESWPRLVIVMFGYGDSRLVILGLRWDRDLSDGIVDPADLVALGYGELLTEGEAT
jgi:hypothetical protein